MAIQDLLKRLGPDPGWGLLKIGTGCADAVG